MEYRYPPSPSEGKILDTEGLRKNFLIEKVFNNDEITMVYSHSDRMIAGSAMPVNKTLVLESGEETGSDFFLQRRELGVINIGGDGKIIVDGKSYNMVSKDGLYIGAGNKKIEFRSESNSNPAKFYLNSSPAHKEYPTVHIAFSNTNPVKLGEMKTSNKRTIYQYVHPKVCKSCQLVMGMTVLEEGCVWNTMPCHTQERRMEVYLYFNMDKNTRVFHLMGRPDETRHIVMKNEQAVISPSWSIHAASATSSYTFIWGMAGENQTFDDMQMVDLENIK